MSYRLAPIGAIRLADGEHIRPAQRAAWAEYQAWRDAGGVPEPMQAAPTQTPSRAERAARLRALLQAHFDRQAEQHGFDSMTDALLHTGFASPVRASAVALGQWEVSCRATVRQIRHEVVAGTREAPTAAELIAELPALVMP